MNALNKIDFENLDYMQIGAGIGVVGGIIWGMNKRFGFGKTALYALLLGVAGAYAGDNIKKLSKNEK